MLVSRSARADETDLDAHRARVDRAEEEVTLEEREAKVERRRRELERHASSGESAKDATRWSHRGRIVFPELVGFTSYAILGAPSASGAIGTSGLLAFDVSSSDIRGGSMTTSTISFRPVVDVFLTDHLTLGVAADAARFQSVTSGASDTSPARSAGYALSLAPRIGRTFDVGAVILWPTLGVGYGVARGEQAATAVTPASRSVARTVSAEVALDVVFPLSANVLFSVGPTMSYRRTHIAGEQAPMFFGDGEDFGAGMRAHLGVTLP